MKFSETKIYEFVKIPKAYLNNKKRKFCHVMFIPNWYGNMFMQILGNFEFKRRLFFEKIIMIVLKLHFCLYNVESRSYIMV